MTKEEAISYLQQLYPNGGHCWLDEQRIEAIDMAIKALKDYGPNLTENIAKTSEKALKQREKEGGPKVSEELEEVAHQYYSPNETFLDGFKKGANWKEQQFEKNRLKHCDALTEEQAQMESDFVVQHLKKNNRTPTFIDAIEYGMRLKEEQLMAKAIDAQCFGFQGAALFSFRLPSDKYLAGSNVKVILIKE